MFSIHYSLSKNSVNKLLYISSNYFVYLLLRDLGWRPFPSKTIVTNTKYSRGCLWVLSLGYHSTLLVEFTLSIPNDSPLGYLLPNLKWLQFTLHLKYLKLFISVFKIVCNISQRTSWWLPKGFLDSNIQDFTTSVSTKENSKRSLMSDYSALYSKSSVYLLFFPSHIILVLKSFTSPTNPSVFKIESPSFDPADKSFHVPVLFPNSPTSMRLPSSLSP